MSTDPYRFVIPRPDPPPTKPHFKETLRFYWQKLSKWGDDNPGKWITGVVALIILICTLIFVPYFYMERAKTDRAAQAWAQQHGGYVLRCHCSAHNYFCSVRTPHDDYRIVYDGVGETEPYIVAKEIP